MNRLEGGENGFAFPRQFFLVTNGTTLSVTCIRFVCPMFAPLTLAEFFVT
jgi:hypothetical protein